MEEDKEQNKKLTRFTAWALFLIIVGVIAAYKIPEYALAPFFDLLGEIITNLIV